MKPHIKTPEGARPPWQEASLTALRAVPSFVQKIRGSEFYLSWKRVQMSDWDREDPLSRLTESFMPDETIG